MGKIKITNYKIKSEINKNIVLISDLHYYNRKNLIKLEIVLNQIKELKPNYICIAGDFIDQSQIQDEDLFIYFLKKISKIAKTVMCFGNHDITIKEKQKVYHFNEELITKIKKIKNLYLLDNETKVIDNIYFIGINLGFDYYHNKETDKGEFMDKFNLIKNINDKKYRILLCHSPIIVSNDDVVDKIDGKIDLVLCGHMHGGLTPSIIQKLLKNKVIISPNKNKLFVKDAYGFFRKKRINFIVSSGITKLSHLNKFENFDFLFSPEIVNIQLDGKN